jgi:hypothetical protein
MFLPSVVPATTRRNLMSIGQNSTSIFRDRRRLLGLIALLLALAEIADAFFVSFPPGPAVFAALLLAGMLWTMRRGGRGGPSILAALFIFEIANAPFWPRHSTGDWISTIAYALVALAGLLVAGPVIFDTREHETRTAHVGA